MASVADILGPSGRIAARLARYEQRPEQLALAEQIASALQAGKHLVAEAGTGVGRLGDEFHEGNQDTPDTIRR